MKVHGLNVVTAAIFIVGEMSGTGVLSLPQAINQSGWFGVALVLGNLFIYKLQNENTRK